MDKISSLLETVLTEIKNRLEEISATGKDSPPNQFEPYIHQLTDLNHQLKVFKRGLDENIHNCESKLNRLEKSIDKQTYISVKLAKEVERKKEVLNFILTDFEKTREQELNNIDEELKTYRMDAAQAMLSEFNQVAIAERDVQNLASLLKKITSFRSKEETIRSKFAELVTSVLGNEMDTEQKDMFDSLSHQVERNTVDLHEQFDLVEKIASEMQKRTVFMHNLYSIRKKQQEEKMTKLREEEKRKGNLLYQAS